MEDIQIEDLLLCLGLPLFLALFSLSNFQFVIPDVFSAGLALHVDQERAVGLGGIMWHLIS